MLENLASTSVHGGYKVAPNYMQYKPQEFGAQRLYTKFYKRPVMSMHLALIMMFQGCTWSDLIVIENCCPWVIEVAGMQSQPAANECFKLWAGSYEMVQCRSRVSLPEFCRCTICSLFASFELNHHHTIRCMALMVPVVIPCSFDRAS